MLFSQLVNELKKGSSGVKEYKIAHDPVIYQAASIEKAKSNEISFIEKGSYLFNSINESNASAVLIPDDITLINKMNSKGISWVSLENPKIGFAESLELLYPDKKPIASIHKTAVIEKDVKIGKEVYIGPNVYIGKGSQIGNNSIIHPGVVIYEKVDIGEYNELHANCVIHRNSKLGKYCIINSNAVIGSEGFGFIPTQKGWRKMPQTGEVVLESNVEIGSGSMVDRPSVGETRIGEGTKIDNLVQIGHGVITGKGCAMASQVGIAGGARIGNRVILAGQVGVGNRVVVGDEVIASSKCGIHADIEPGKIVSGFPAISNKLWLRCAANFKKLPEMAKNIKQLNQINSD